MTMVWGVQRMLLSTSKVKNRYQLKADSFGTLLSPFVSAKRTVSSSPNHAAQAYDKYF